MTTTPIMNSNKSENLTIRIPFDKIVIDESFNVRGNYEDIPELADSIGGIGLEEPLVLRKNNNSLNSGFRRYKAIQLLMKSDKPNAIVKDFIANGIPCRIKEFESDTLAMISNMAENTGKRSLRTYDMAKRFYEFEEKHGMKRKKIAEFCGVTTGYISQLVSLIEKLSPEIVEVWGNKEITASKEIPVMTLREWSKENHETQAKLLTDYLGDGEGIEDPNAEPDEKSNTKIGGKAPSKTAIKEEIDRLESLKRDEKITDMQLGMLKALKWVAGKTKTLK